MLAAATCSPTAAAAELTKEAGVILLQAAALRDACVWYMPEKLEASAERIQAIARRLCSESDQTLPNEGAAQSHE